jgi:hypothetical protein
MKLITTIIMIAVAAAACTPKIEDFNTPAWRCTDAAWGDDTIAVWHGLKGLSHRDLYLECAKRDKQGRLPLMTLEQIEAERERYRLEDAGR